MFILTFYANITISSQTLEPCITIQIRRIIPPLIYLIAPIFDGTVALVNIQPVIAIVDRSTVDINREKVYVTFYGENMILNGESVGVSKTVGGGASSAVLEVESIEMSV